MSFRHIITYCALTLLGFICSPNFMADAASTMAFRHYGIEQGMSQSSVLSITQDKLGNLWFGTQDGLNMYDGYGFHVYKNNFADPKSLPSAFVGALITDSKGRIWAGTSSGLTRFDACNNCFESFSNAPNCSVNHISTYGELLALSTDNGLFLFDPEDNSSKPIPLGTECVVRSTFPRERSLLVASDAGLFLLNDEKVVPVPAFAGVDVHAVAPSQDGGWWIGVYGKGLYRTDARLGVLRHYSGKGMLPSDYVRVLHTDNYGRLWVGTYDGLAVYDDLEGVFHVCRHDLTPSSLSHDSVRAIFSDADNGVWIGTWFGGVNYWNRQDEKIREVSLSSEGIYGFVSCLCQDPVSKRIWIGTNDDGLFHYSPDDGSVFRPDIPLVSGNVKCIVPGHDGFLYVGMHMGGIMRLDPRSFKARGFAINNHAPIKNGCYSLLEIENGRWLVGSLEGLFLFNVKSGEIIPHPSVILMPELGKRLITVLFKDRSGRIWIGTDERLFLLSISDNSVQSQSELFPAIGGAGLHVNQITQDINGRIWIASSRGLLEYSGISEPRLYTTEDGLPDNNIRAVLDDGESLWFCSGRQICRFVKETRKVTAINRPTGNEFVESAACVGSDGFLYFGGLGGITRFDPQDLYSNPFSPKPYFSGVGFDNRIKGVIERDDSGACTSVRIPSYKGPLVIHWSVVNPLSYGADVYYYRLDGLDDKWQKTLNRQAIFTNLAPGNYILQLRCANNEGIFCDGFVSLAIRILPRWWQSSLFRASLILVSILLVGLFVFLVTSLLRSKIRLHTRDAEIRRLEDNLDKTRDLISGQIRAGMSGETSPDGEFLHRATMVVEANIDNDAFSTDEFASQMYMSRSKLYARIQETTGGTVADFIRKIRFDKACDLLLEGRYSVAEISSMVGFSSASYFATSFKKHVGCLPKEYGKGSPTAQSEGWV